MTEAQLGRIVRLYGASLHGSCGEWMDIEFPSIVSAAAFIESMGWHSDARLRDAVTRFSGVVVVQVPEPLWRSFDPVRDLLGKGDK